MVNPTTRSNCMSRVRHYTQLPLDEDGNLQPADIRHPIGTENCGLTVSDLQSERLKFPKDMQEVIELSVRNHKWFDASLKNKRARKCLDDILDAHDMSTYEDEIVRTCWEVKVISFIHNKVTKWKKEGRLEEILTPSGRKKIVWVDAEDEDDSDDEGEEVPLPAANLQPLSRGRLKIDQVKSLIDEIQKFGDPEVLEELKTTLNNAIARLNT